MDAKEASRVIWASRKPSVFRELHQKVILDFLVRKTALVGLFASDERRSLLLGLVETLATQLLRSSGYHEIRGDGFHAV